MASPEQTTFDLLKNSILSQPRMMGTEGEKETTRFLLDHLSQHQLQPYTEDIEWSTASMNGRKYLFGLMGIFTILFNVSTRLSPPINGIVSVALPLVAISCLLSFGLGLRNNGFKFLGTSAIGKNVICQIKPAKSKMPQTTVYFTAHTDSVATNMPGLYLPLNVGILLGFMLIVALTGLSGVSVLLNYYELWQGNFLIDMLNSVVLIFGCINLLLIFLSLFTKRINTSPGACDNGSGSAILLSLAKHFREHPPEHIQMNFIWCAAEEWGLYGSKGYVQAHKDEIAVNRETSYVFNVDMVSSELAYLDKAGLLIKKPINSKLNSIIAQTANEIGIEAQRFNSMLSGNSDHASFQKENVEVCFFLTQKDMKVMHSRRDTIERVKPDVLEDAVLLIQKVVEKIDTL